MELWASQVFAVCGRYGRHRFGRFVGVRVEHFS